MEREYASKGVAGTALGFGIAGTVGALLNGGLEAARAATKNGNGNCICSENTAVNRYELNMTQEIGAKNAEISLLKANAYFDQKLVEVYTTLDRRDKELRDLIGKNKDEQYAINMNQAVLNGTTGATISCLQAQVSQLQGLTKLVIPATSVCPEPMPAKNSWTAPTAAAAAGA